MAGGSMTAGPTPWWQLPQNKGTLSNLQGSAPSGYEYDPVQMGYTRTPSSAGSRAGQFTESYLNGVPSLNGLVSGASNMVNNAAGTGTPGAAGGAPGTAGAASTGVTGGGTGGGTGAPVPGAMGSGGSYVPAIQAPDMTAANNATFAAAKNKAGQVARSSIDSLAGELGSKGMLGSGAQVQGTRDVVNNAAGMLGNEVNQEAITNADMAEKNAVTGYQGAITQRGQDIQANEALWNRNLDMLKTALSGLSSGAYGTVPAPGLSY